MTFARTVPILLLLSLALTACNGGGGGRQATVNAINVNPATPSAGSLVQLSGNISGGNAGTVKTWEVDKGSLSTSPPDFAILLRATASKQGSAVTSTTGETVYWITPPEGGQATITLTADSSTRSRTVTLGQSPLTLSVSDHDGGKRVQIVASDVTDLYQAAFRISHSSAWDPTSASQGDFLGTASQTLFFSMTNQNGFVPVAITRRGSLPGVDGTGALATIDFAPAGGTSSARSVAETTQPFELQLVVLRTSADEPIAY